MAKFKTQVEGKEVEIDLGDAFVPKDELATNYMPKSAFQEELTRRTSSITSNQAEKLLDDEEFRNKALDKWGVKPEPEEKKTKDLAEHVTRERTTWEQKHLKPLQTQLQERDTELSGLREKMLQSEITAAAAPFVKKALLKRPTAEVPPPIVSMLQGVFAYDNKTKTFYVKNGDTFAFTSKPAEGGSPYKTVAEFIAEWAEDKGNSDWVEDKRQTGPGLGSTGGSRAGAPHAISRADARDPAKYRAAREAAAKVGVTLQIVD